MSFDLPGHGQSPYQSGILEAVQKTLRSFNSPLFLVGYSMGGRISLMLSREPYVQGIIALSSHRGLDSTLAKNHRKQQDLTWSHLLKTLEPTEFLDLWYKQPVFSSLQKKPALLSHLILKRIYNNPENLSAVLEEMSLAHQPFLHTFCKPTCFMFGSEDTKYQDLYAGLPSNVLIKKIDKAGHAVLEENPEDVIKNLFHFFAKPTM